jgi:pimeloyl-ACP methyl ester carboxylesterase
MGDGAVPLYFFHGLMPVASGRIGTELARELVGRSDVRVYGVDAPGFGESPAPPTDDGYDMDGLAGRLRAVVGDLAADDVVLMGHSWGAALACRVATMLDRRPLALVLLDGGHFDHADLPEADPSETVEDVRREMVAQDWAVEAPTLETCVARVAGVAVDDVAVTGRPGLREAVRAGLVETARGLGSAVSLDHAAAAMHALMRSRSSVAYPGIAAAGIPVLLLIATQPHQRAAMNRQRVEAFRERLPDLTVVEMPSGHDIPVGAPVDAAHAIAGWLAARAIAAPPGDRR